MSQLVGEKTAYGNWVPSRFVVLPGVLTLLFAGFSFLHPASAVVAVIFFVFFLYLACARYLFSPRGGDVQARIQGLLLDRVMDWDGLGKALDIGCGDGLLTIEIAKRHPQAEVIGVDYWGASGEYSKSVCVRNAEIEGVSERVSFNRADASSLPFDDQAFDMVVSNLVFHNVMDVRDKSLLIKEALRVLKKGGLFVFQDLFLWKRVYGEVDDLVEAIRSWGIETVEFVDTSDSDFIPTALKLPFMVGTVGILHGRR